MYYTYPSFEYWILLSFINRAKAFSTVNLKLEEIIIELKEKYNFNFKKGKNIPETKIKELINRRNNGAKNSEIIAGCYTYNLTTKPSLEQFKEICQDTTNKSNLHQLMNLIDASN